MVGKKYRFWEKIRNINDCNIIGPGLLIRLRYTNKVCIERIEFEDHILPIKDQQLGGDQVAISTHVVGVSCSCLQL